MDHGILTTRFNNVTYLELCRWKINNEYAGCIYNTKSRISNLNDYKIPYFVLEMNNVLNKIVGIGLIYINISNIKEYIYSDNYLNRYTYKGEIHISMDDIELDEEEKNYFIENIENPLFYGKGHMKRGMGITSFPKHKIKKEMIDLLKKIVYNN